MRKVQSHEQADELSMYQLRGENEMKHEIVERLLSMAPTQIEFETTGGISNILANYRDAFIEKLAESAVVVYGHRNSQLYTTTESAGSRPSESTAILLDVREIKKVDPNKELLKRLREHSEKPYSALGMDNVGGLFRAAEQERDELKSELGRWKMVQPKNLEDYLDLMKERDAARAEVERLRAALEKLRDRLEEHACNAFETGLLKITYEALKGES